MRALPMVVILVGVCARVGCAEMMAELAKPYHGPIVMEELSRNRVPVTSASALAVQSIIDAWAQQTCGQYGNVAVSAILFSVYELS